MFHLKTNEVVTPSQLADLFQVKTLKQSILHFVRRRDNYIGYRVRHIEHGLGTVDSFDGTIITVTFDNHQTKSYNFNKSIQGGYLNFAA